MVTIALILIVGIAIGSLLSNTQKFYYHTNDRIQARQESSHVIRMMERELRQITKASDDFESVELADKNRLVFFSDIDNDNKPEKISYQLNGQEIIKTITQTSNDAAPWEFNGAQNQQKVTESATNNDAKPMFTYYSAMDQQLSQVPLSMPNREAVKIIKIEIRILLPKGVKEDRYDTEVYLRNKNDPL